MNLNKSQLQAENEIVRFLMGNEQCLLLQAPSGYGKTFLLNHIRKNKSNYLKRAKVLGSTFPLSDYCFTAPTNKAASLGINGTTVHKALGLRPVTDYTTGERSLVQKIALSLDVGIVDEFSMLNTELLKFVLKSFTKIIFVGDKFQLPPVNEVISPVLTLGIKEVTLTEPMRQRADSTLFALCEHLRAMITATGITPFKLSEDVVHITSVTMQKMLHTHFTPECNNKIITFTNNKAIKVNKHIRSIHGHVGYWKVGELVVAKSSSISVEGVRSIVEQDYIVTDVNEAIQQVAIDGAWFNVGRNHQQIINKVKQLRRDKEYRQATELSEEWLDLRSSYAGTCHSAQGSSYDNVFIDLTDFNSCRDLGILKRLLYVAVSRATTKVYFYGSSAFNLW